MSAVAGGNGYERDAIRPEPFAGWFLMIVWALENEFALAELPEVYFEVDQFRTGKSRKDNVYVRGITGFDVTYVDTDAVD